MLRSKVLAGLAAAVAGVVLLAVLPPVRARLAAAGVVADALGLPAVRPLAGDVHRRDAHPGGVPGDLYSPGRPAPAVVLLPGATPAGRDDARVVRVARSLAAAGRTVFVPELAVYDQRLVAADVERIVAATQALTRPPGDGPVVLAGISFGGSLGLLAAADRRLSADVAGVMTLGAYADLIGVVQAGTTGTALVGDRRFPWDADPRAERVIREQLVGLLPPSARATVTDALAGGSLPEEAGEPARTVFALLANDDAEATPELARRLPADLRDRIRAISPVSVADRVSVPVIAVHARDDPVVPYGELHRLLAAVPAARAVTLDSFGHTDLRGGSPTEIAHAARDLYRLVDVVAALLRWQ